MPSIWANFDHVFEVSFSGAQKSRHSKPKCTFNVQNKMSFKEQFSQLKQIHPRVHSEEYAESMEFN